MSRCFVFGCSHSAGMGMTSADRSLIAHDCVYDKTTYGYHHSYAAIVGRELGYIDIHNHSIPGGSTDAMLRIFREIVDTIDPDRDLVIACWTGGDRSEYWEPDHEIWVQLTANKTGFRLLRPSIIALQGLPVGDNVVTERFQQQQRKWVLESSFDSAMRRLETNMLAMNQLARDREIRLMNLCSFTIGHFPEITIKGHWPDYSQVGDYWWPIGTWTSFLEFCKKRGFKPDMWGHHDEPAHRAFADMILDKISQAKSSRA